MNNRPAICVIQTVLKNRHDLVIKESEKNESTTGFKAIDTQLLRKCPCPVWIFKPSKHPRKNVQVLVAIDPENREARIRSLSKKMIELASSISENYNGELHIISCWKYEPETFLRISHWVEMPPSEVDQLILDLEQDHKERLQSLIKESNISGPYRTHHLRGFSEELIPDFVKDKNIDTLLMGSVGRTGILGYFIGNIIQKLHSSLIVLKPSGFIGPVTEE